MARRDRHPELPFGDERPPEGRARAAEPKRARAIEPASAPIDAPIDAPADAPIDAPADADKPRVLSVGELDRMLRKIIEGAAGDVRVEGEISGLKVVASGHAYFTLKDEADEASIDCVMYRTAAPRSKRLLADGARVILAGKATVYVPRGRLQLLVDSATLAGRGALLLALERLKEKLASEGLFDPGKRRPLPEEPRVIGVVTSPNGAAIHDIITVAFRRGGARIVLAPAPVQGPTAAHKIAQAIELLEKVPDIDAIIVGRGGGSADDLSAYNDEELVRRVAATRVPIISAVGHEIDTTLTDLAADARAATPSQAAEMLVADADARDAEIEHLRSRMRRALRHRIDSARALVERQRAALGSPEAIIDERRQAIDDALARLQAQLARSITRRRAEVARMERGLAVHHPSAVIERARASIGPLAVRIDAAMRARLARLRRKLAASAVRVDPAMRAHLARLRRKLAASAVGLDALSPLAVLGRGYAIAEGPSGRAVRDASEVAPGDKLHLRVHRGALDVEVTSVTPPDAPRGDE